MVAGLKQKKNIPYGFFLYIFFLYHKLFSTLFLYPSKKTTKKKKKKKSLYLNPNFSLFLSLLPGNSVSALKPKRASY
jgi:hypothetical protein